MATSNDGSLAPGEENARGEHRGVSRMEEHLEKRVKDRRRADVELRESEERFRALVRNSSDVIAVVQADGTVTYESSAVERVLGYKPEELVGTDGFALVHPDDAPMARRVLADLLESPGATWSAELRGRHRDGSWRHLEVTSTNLLDEPSIAGIVVNYRDVTERKEAEEALRKSQERHRLIIRATNEVIWDHDLTTGKQEWNGAIHAVFGYRPGEIGDDARWWEERIHPEDRARVLSGVDAILASGEEAWSDEYRFCRGDGTYAVVVDRGYVVRGERGEPLRMLGSMMDITDRERAVDALRESEERFRLVARATNEVIWDSDMRADSQVWDGAVEEMFGYPAGQVTDTAWWEERVHPDDRGRVTASVEAVLREDGGEVWSEEYRFRRADGGYSVVADRAYVVRGAGTGEPVRVLGSMADVSERRRAEEALRESEERFRVLIQNALDIIMVTDADGTIRYISPSVERVLGYRPEEMIGVNTAVYVHPDDLEGAFGELALAVARPGVHPVAVETRVRHKSGSWRWLEGIANNLLGDPAVKGLVFNHRDVTERKWSERELARRAAELESSNAELERFAYAVAHDLRAPLRTISSFSQLLLEDHAGGLDEEGEDYLRRVGNAGRHMAQVMDALLDLSRIARAEMRHEEVDLSSLAEGIAADLRRSHPERRVGFAIRGDLVVEGDRRLLRGALENLLGNAWKFSANEPEARIEFGATDEDGAPAYYVRDNGAGFDEAYAGKLFGAFQRLHGQDEFEGVGVGLAAVARVVRRHGGRVWAEGRVGRGATFYFTL